ncbi:uncharacterized protein LOC119770643 [Culex quinquefasciatus]|nr:uncharacterized protein LOC119770643 [Culex quinquefasciatus]
MATLEKADSGMIASAEPAPRPARKKMLASGKKSSAAAGCADRPLTSPGQGHQRKMLSSGRKSSKFIPSEAWLRRRPLPDLQPPRIEPRRQEKRPGTRRINRT